MAGSSVRDPVLAASRQAIKRGSRSFAAASTLLPPDVRHSAHLLYHWCRHCDDAVDGQRLGFAAEDARTKDEAVRVLERLREQTDAAAHGAAVTGVPFLALQRVIRRHDLPAALAHAHLDGFAMDVGGAAYRNIDDTIRYSYHVAGVVGVMMAWIMGVRDHDTLDRAADLGIAFQLTNIARDVMDDAANGRVYLPESWLRMHGVEPAAVADRENRVAVARVVRRLLDEADRYYESAEVGVSRLPARVAWGIGTAAMVYRDIGRIVRKRGAHAWDRRAAVGGPRKVGLAIAAGGAVLRRALYKRNREVERDGLWPIPRLRFT